MSCTKVDTLNYYEYQYLLLSYLSQKLKITTINLNTDTQNVYATVRNSDNKIEPNKLVHTFITDDSIQLIFDQGYRCWNYHYTISTKWLRQLYNDKIPPEYVAEGITRNICDDVLNKYILKQKEE